MSIILILLSMGCISSGFYLFNHTFKNSSSYNSDQGTIRILISTTAIGTGAIVLWLFFTLN